MLHKTNSCTECVLFFFGIIADFISHTEMINYYVGTGKHRESESMGVEPRAPACITSALLLTYNNQAAISPLNPLHILHSWDWMLQLLVYRARPAWSSLTHWKLEVREGSLLNRLCNHILSIGRFRNLERGVQPLAREVHPKIFGLPRPFRSHWKSELNISKQL